MSEIVDGDRVRLINEGSTFTSEGTLVQEGTPGTVIGHKGFSDLVVWWFGLGAYGVVSTTSVAVERRTRS